MVDVLVVGGGIVGLLSALELRRRGAEVAVIDAASARPPASWAGGGILSPLFPWRYPSAVTLLCRHALADYRELAEQIRGSGGVDPELRVRGMLALTEDASGDVQAWAQAQGVVVIQEDGGMWLSALAGRPAWLLPEVGSIRNPRLMKGLRHLLEREGVTIHTGLAQRIELERASAKVHTDEATLGAQHILIAAGWWSQELLASLGVLSPIQPVKGQMLLYRLPADDQMPVILSEQGYLIPRADGHMLVGSTVEPGVADQVPTAQAAARLRQVAADLLPELATLEPVGHWAGVRPGTNRAVPVIDRLDEEGHLWLCSGHYRNGLVMAPASARLVAQMITGEKPQLDPRHYSFSSPGSSDSFCSR